VIGIIAIANSIEQKLVYKNETFS